MGGDGIELDVIVDAHHHLWDHSTRPYRIAELRCDAASVPDVCCSVFVECRSAYRSLGPEVLRPIGETEYVVASDPDGFVAGIVGFADLLSPEVTDVLDGHIEAGGGRFRGIRYGCASDPSAAIRDFYTRPAPGVLGDPELRRGVAAIGAAGLIFETFVFHPQLPELVDVCRALPDVLVVFDHLGGPLGIGPYEHRRDEVSAAWRSSMSALAACDNVRLKLGGVGMAIHGTHWRNDARAGVGQIVERWREPVRWCIEEFGPDRCMFESNFPVDKASFGYADLWAAFRAITEDASATDREALFAGTAIRTYRLDDAIVSS